MRNLKSDINRFNFGQLTSNSDGKTSASGTAGLYIIFIGGICFLMGCIQRMFIDQSIDIITQSIVFVSIGAGLLGYRKFIATKNITLNDNDNCKDENKSLKELTSEDQMLKS